MQAHREAGGLEILFWFCAAALVWTYVGFPLLMLARARWGAHASGRARESGPRPRVNVILAVRNAAEQLPRRLEDLFEQDYPGDLLEVTVVCNGCTDDSEEVARRYKAQDPRIRVLRSPADHGKAGAINVGVAHADAEILVFADVRQLFERSAISELVRTFADRRVGGVTGRLVIARGVDRAVAQGLGRYWQWETRLRLAESRTGSVVGVTGAIYAIRRRLFTPLPPAVILDDVFVPMSIVMKGWRVTMAEGAVAYDQPGPGYRFEYRRRVRTLVGNLELIRLMPQLLSPRSNPILMRYVSHKLFRVLTPVFCVALVIAGFLSAGAAYQAVAAAFVLLYALGAVGLVAPLRILALPSTFLLLHAAGLTALVRSRRGAADLWAS